MKKLIILIVLFAAFNSIAQTDTTVIFTDTTITQYEAELLFESDWKIDSSNFDISKDSIYVTSRWLQKDSIYVNQNRYRIIEVQKKENAQGIKARKIRRIRYQRETRIRRKIKH